MTNLLRRAFAGDTIRRIVRTGLIAFAFVLVPGLLGWLHAVSDWASSSGQHPLPDAHNLTYLLVSAITAGFIAVGNALVLVIENLSGHGFLRPAPTRDLKAKVPTTGPDGTHGTGRTFSAGNDHGSASARLLAAVAATMTVVLAGLFLAPAQATDWGSGTITYVEFQHINNAEPKGSLQAPNSVEGATQATGTLTRVWTDSKGRPRREITYNGKPGTGDCGMEQNGCEVTLQYAVRLGDPAGYWTTLGTEWWCNLSDCTPYVYPDA
jgi:hypothetical protein